MVFSDESSKWEKLGEGGICYYHFNDKLQGFCENNSIFHLCYVFLCVWYKSSADHLYLTMAQLAGIGLQEFARICLYNVIKAFLGPAASA